MSASNCLIQIIVKSETVIISSRRNIYTVTEKVPQNKKIIFANSNSHSFMI